MKIIQKYVPFVGLCLGFFIIIMDTTTVPLTYTTLMGVFNVAPVTVAWINNIYLITYAAFLLMGGKLGDNTNRKLIVLTAYLAIGAGAAISGAGQTFVDIIIGRALMGLGAGLLTPQSMAYISILFAKSGRGAALGIWAGVAGVATAIGPVVTQLFLTIASWRWVMWINIPIVFVCFLIAAWSLPNIPSQKFRFWDTTISGLYGVCLAGIIIGIQLITGADTILGSTLIMAGALVTMILIKNDVKKECGNILSKKLWLDFNFLKVCLISGLLGAGLTSFYLPLAFLLDARMGFSPAAISTIMITIALSSALVGPFSGSLSDRMEPEKIIRLGLILFALANGLLGFIGMILSGGSLAFIALCTTMVVAGVGAGLAFAPLANLALRRTQPTNVGQAMAFFNSVRQVLSALGSVIVAIIFDFVIHLQLGYNLPVTTENLRKTSSVTAIASLSGFLFVALSLMAAAYISHSNKQKLADVSKQNYTEALDT